MLGVISSAQRSKVIPPQVVIVGAGFGGLWAAKTLANAPVEVVVIDRQNYHLFQPLHSTKPSRTLFRRPIRFQSSSRRRPPPTATGKDLKYNF
jgi:cation diffusion facilitator CzcD-associated flavoprotein CzcO